MITTESQPPAVPLRLAAPGPLQRLSWLIEPGLTIGATLVAAAGGGLTSLVLLAVPAVWLARRLRCGGGLLVRTPYDRAVVLLLLTLPLWLLSVVDWSDALPKLTGILGGIAIIYALARAGDRVERIATLAWLAALLLEALLVCVALVSTSWQAADKIDALQPLVRHLPVLLRTVSQGSADGGVNPNELGGAAVLVLPLALVVVWRGRRPARRPSDLFFVSVPCVGAALLVGVLVVSQSRSAYAGLLSQVAFCGMFAATARLGRRARALACAVAVVGGLALALVVWRAASGSLTDASGLDTVASRLELWQRGLRMIGDFPLTGIGPGQFDLVLHRLFPPLLVRGDVYVAHAHNWFIQLALDLGLIGAAALLWLVVRFFRALAVAGSRAPEPQLRPLALALAAGMLGYLTFGLTDAIALGARGGLGFWIVLGLGAALWRTSRTAASSAVDR